MCLKSVWTWCIWVRVTGEELLSETGPTAWRHPSTVQTLSLEWIRPLACGSPNNLLIQKAGISWLAWLGFHSQMSSQETIFPTQYVLFWEQEGSVHLLLSLKMKGNKSRLGNSSEAMRSLVCRFLFRTLSSFCKNQPYCQGGLLPNGCTGLPCPGQVLWPRVYSMPKPVTILSTSIG